MPTQRRRAHKRASKGARLHAPPRDDIGFVNRVSGIRKGDRPDRSGTEGQHRG